jgi:hypothetical protein
MTSENESAERSRPPLGESATSAGTAEPPADSRNNKTPEQSGTGSDDRSRNQERASQDSAINHDKAKADNQKLIVRNQLPAPKSLAELKEQLDQDSRRRERIVKRAFYVVFVACIVLLIAATVLRADLLRPGLLTLAFAVVAALVDHFFLRSAFEPAGKDLETSVHLEALYEFLGELPPSTSKDSRAEAEQKPLDTDFAASKNREWEEKTKKKERIERLKLHRELLAKQYEKQLDRYENIYKAIWQQFQYIALASGAIGAFSKTDWSTSVRVFITLTPLVFWMTSSFLPMDHYGNQLRNHLSELEKTLTNLSFAITGIGLENGDKAKLESLGFEHFQRYKAASYKWHVKDSVKLWMLPIAMIWCFVGVQTTELLLQNRKETTAAQKVACSLTVTSGDTARAALSVMADSGLAGVSCGSSVDRTVPKDAARLKSPEVTAQPATAPETTKPQAMDSVSRAASTNARKKSSHKE